MNIIRQVQLATQNEPLVPLAEKVLVNGVTLRGDDYGIDIDPPYQREPVWGDERRRNLIRSILMGLPIGALTFNERPFPEWRVCIDGKQRLLAVRAFITDQLAVPADWFSGKCLTDQRDAFYYSASADLVRWSMLSEAGRRVFDSQAVTVTHTAQIRPADRSTRFTEADTVKREQELFELINYGGVPQGERDKGAA